jgi:anti-anti-sigma regulatory factor
LAAPDKPPSSTRLTGPLPRPTTIEFDVGPGIAPGDIEGLCERARAGLEDVDDGQLVCDVGAIHDPDAATVDALARLKLTARRLGRDAWLRDASPELQDLLHFMGLSKILPLSARSRLQARRQTEEREQVRGVEEERDPADPAG